MQINKQTPLIIELVEEIWKKHPHLRFFQCVEYIKARLPNEYKGINNDYYYMKDKDLIKQLTNLTGSDII